ncbi:hypothetical protein [Clostridium folliculivorans]|uniref:Uncharacterized protein n=1 Tax=Clostridium folliculivorans TaxID=2886038 RepID=A0A9W5XYE1_9CLOT|nr:hypothetical protein [Clostridium folliculivorans]GKU23301.1 hypothetical protein CFOLD11_01270 [Clostridium folliculivorans]GKU29418.1 hypothetical protein CFB3_15240 [Clostridium folliculivorans]
MHISKAVKKQKKSYRLFLLSMLFLFFALPIIVFLLGKTTIFYTSYLAFLEVFILIAIFAVANSIAIDFQCSNNKLKIRTGLLKSENVILCDKVVLVHTEGKDENMEMIIVTTVKLRNKFMKPITKSFFKKYPYVANEYRKIKILKPEELYYFTIIKHGGLLKYQLLDLVYRNCVKAIYTDLSIENVKIARGQLEI